MTTRMLNPTTRIISRMTNSRLKAKLLKAGATSVVSPNAIGALRMASGVTGRRKASRRCHCGITASLQARARLSKARRERTR